MTVAMIEWTNPLWAAGLVAGIGVPVLVHMLSQRGGRVAVFPTTRFIEKAVDDGRRRSRPQQLLLMLLRALMLCAIVGAMARPVWFSESGNALLRGRGVTAVFVLDRSASMNRVEGGATLFEIARRDVVEAIESLDPSTDRAMVVLVDATPGAILPDPTGNFTLLKQMLDAVTPSLEKGDLASALALAEEAGVGRGDGESGRHVRIELFSDMQATQLDDAARGVAIHQVGNATDNVALFGARVNPVEPLVNQAAIATVEVANFAVKGRATFRIRMTVGDQRPVDRQVRVGAGTSATVGFALVLQKPGLRDVSFELLDGGDAFTLDDQTGVFVNVREARRVVLVTAADVNATDNAAYYLSRGLTPDDRSGVEVDVWKPTDIAQRLSREAHKAPAAMVIAEADMLPADALSKVRAYLNFGGAVVWMIDSGEAVESLRRFGELDGDAQLSPIVEGAWSKRADSSIDGGRFESPILSVFEGAARNGLLRQRFGAVMRGKLASTAQLQLSFDDGSPALATQWVGSGRLAVLAADLAPVHGDFVKQGGFVPLIHQLVRKLTPGPPAPPIPHPGDRPMLVMTGNWQRDAVIVESPGDSVALQLRADDDFTIGQFERVGLPGRYAITDSKTNVLIGGTHVGIHEDESDFRVGETIAAAPVDGGDAVAESMAAPLRSTGTELWHWLLASALLVLVVEQIVASLDGLPARKLASN